MTDATRKRHRRRSVQPEVLDAIGEHALRGRTPGEIQRKLDLDERLSSFDKPSLRTIQRVVRDLNPRDDSGPWSLAEANGEDPALILPALSHAIDMGLTLTNGEADLLLKIRQAAPGLPAFQAYLLARVYRWRRAQDRQTDDLDAYLAFAPWDKENRGRWNAAVKAGRVKIIGSMIWTEEDWEQFVASDQSKGDLAKQTRAMQQKGSIQ